MHNRLVSSQSTSSRQNKQLSSNSIGRVGSSVANEQAVGRIGSSVKVICLLPTVPVDLEKAFDRVPQKVIWWALRKLGVEEWIVRLVQGMYANARSRVRVGEGYSEEFEVHQGSVLSPLLFIIVLEALSREFCSEVPWEDFYADDLVIIAESLEECVRRLLTWKEATEKKGLKNKCRKDKDHDLRYGTGPPAEFRRVSMCRLLHWSGQQQHLLQWLQALGAQEMQWAQVLEKGP